MYSRIDYIFISQKWLQLFNKAEIGTSIRSDHTPISASFTIPQVTAQEFNWKFNDSILHTPENKSKIEQMIRQTIEENNHSDISPATLWETLKCVLRGKLISFCSILKKDRERRVNELLKDILKLEQSHKAKIEQSTYTELEAKRIQLKTLLDQYTNKAFMSTKQKYYELGDKCNKHFAKLLRKIQPQTLVQSIKDTNQKTLYDTKNIAKSFQQYYQKLYKLDPQGPIKDLQERMKTFIREAQLPNLTPDQKNSLDRPFTHQEITETIDSFPAGKSPGPDGYSTLYYKTHKNELTPILCDYFNSIDGKLNFHPQANEAHIIVIPKQGKDPQQPASYRPISLINIDLKIYAKIIANRLKMHLSFLVNPDQAGFVPKREGKDNIYKVISVIQLVKSKQIPTLLLTIDTEKAFDRVSWHFLRETLLGFGLGETTIKRILALYHNPTARIRVNGVLSPPVQIHNGTRQGCPLSPLLFVLVMETLLAHIRLNPDISGIISKSKEYKSAAFADDLLLFITRPIISLPSILKLFNAYGSLSNFKVNLSKSEILNINLPKTSQTTLESNFQFKWAKNNIQYLGVKIDADHTKAYQNNYLPLLGKIQNLASHWSKLKLSWFSKIQAVKMTLMRKVLYTSQALPIKLPMAFFKSLKTIITKLIWQGKNARLKYKQLILPKESGGLTLPDAQLYWMATHLSQIHAWHVNKNKNWVTLENTFSDILIQNLPLVKNRINSHLNG
uniref:Reverse transcriptase domain-containing protein n=1 Tax=Xenopus tropicalis TaxID=8364 RepID=A0A803K7A0_XENTR